MLDNGESTKKRNKGLTSAKELTERSFAPQIRPSLGRSAHNAAVLPNRQRCAKTSRTTPLNKQNAQPPAINRKENKTMGEKSISF